MKKAPSQKAELGFQGSIMKFRRSHTLIIQKHVFSPGDSIGSAAFHPGERPQTRLNLLSFADSLEILNRRLAHSRSFRGESSKPRFLVWHLLSRSDCSIPIFQGFPEISSRHNLDKSFFLVYHKKSNYSYKRAS